MSTCQISHTTELMQNYLHSDVMSPEEKFLALQTNAGASLLFSISTEKVFYVTKEMHGDVNHRRGWDRRDMRGDQIKASFPQGACKDFAAAQCVHAKDATIQLALVIDDGANDHLYLSIGNSDSDTSWTDTPKWIPCPFNAKDAGQQPLSPPQPFKIAKVFIGEATDQNPIVVDVLRDPQDAGPLISRYFIDVSNPASPTWQAHEVDVQMEAKDLKTCIGRRQPAGHLEKKSPSDGLYTSGVVSGHSQFTYKPLKSPYGEPKSSILKLTADDSPPPPNAIAACRKPDNTSDLYASHGGSLYYFASDKQFTDDVAVKVVENRLFTDVKDLFASVTNGIVTVWGRNGSDDVFYTTCPLEKITEKPSSWSTPLAIMTGVQNVTPYVNKADTAKIFFAHTQANEFKIAMKSPKKNGTWRFRNIHLPPSKSKQPAQSFHSYTTRVTVTREDKHPARGVDVVIKSTNRTSVYINHLYYVVGPVPITVKTDGKGSLTIAEEVTRLDSTSLSLSIDGDTVSAPYTIDPMADSPHANEQLKKLQSEDSLNNEKIHYQNEKVRPAKNLVKANAPQSDVSSAAKNNKNLWATHAHLQGRTSAGNLALMSAGGHSPEYDALVQGAPVVVVDGGDLFSMIESKYAHHVRTAQALGATSAAGWSLWEAIVDFFNEAWNLVVKIGEEIFTFIFETVEQVYEAFKYLFNKIVEIIDDLIDYCQYLFDSDDIIRTQEVMKNLIKLALEHQVDGIKDFKKDIDKKIGDLEKQIDHWAGLDWGAKLGDEGKKTLGSRTEQSRAQTGPDWLLADHFEGNIEDAVPEGSVNLPELPSNPLNTILNAVKSEINLAGDLFTELGKLADELFTISIDDLLKRLAGIVAHFGLETAKIIIDAVLDIVYDLAKSVLKLLDTEIYIPVVSDILDLFGVPRFSLLDVVCFIGAIPTTIAFKLTTKQPPFPDNADTRFLIEATDFKSVLNKLSGLEPRMNVAALGDSQPVALDNLTMDGINFDKRRTDTFLAFRFFSFFSGTLGAVVGPFDALAPTVVEGFDGLGCVNMLLTIVGGTSQLISGAFWPKANLTSNETFFNRLVASTRLVLLAGLNKPFKTFSNGAFRKWSVSKAVLAGIDTIFCAVSSFVMMQNLIDLRSKHPANATDKALLECAYVEEFGNLSAYLARVARLGTVVTTDRAQVPINGFLAVGYGLLQAGYGATQLYIFIRVEELARNQRALAG